MLLTLHHLAPAVEQVAAMAETASNAALNNCQAGAPTPAKSVREIVGGAAACKLVAHLSLQVARIAPGFIAYRLNQCFRIV